jgi:hypothetical protein
MKKAGIAFAFVIIFLVPFASGPITNDGFSFNKNPTAGGDNSVPSDWQDTNSGIGNPLPGTINGLHVASGTSVIDYSHSAYVGIDPPLGWSSEGLEADLDHLSMWVDDVLVNPKLDTYHEEHWFLTDHPEYNYDPFFIPDDWTFVKNDAVPSGTQHPQHGYFEINRVAGAGYDASSGWRFDANLGSGATINPTNGFYMSQQIPMPWRNVYSAEISFQYYVSSTSTLNDEVFISTSLEGYVSKYHVFELGTPMDTWLQASTTVPSSYFESLPTMNALLFNIGLGTDINGNPSSADHEVFIDEIEVRLLVRPFPEQIDLLANGARVTGSTQGSVSPYVPDGTNRDCYSAPDSNGGSGGVDLNGRGDNGWLRVGANVTTTFGSDWSDAFAYQVGFQFPLYIPQGASINSANLRVEAVSDSTGFPGMRVYVADEDNVAAFTSGYPLLPDRYEWVNTSVYWRPTTWTANGRYDTPDISSLIQEVVSRPGWQSGNYICIMIDYGYSNQQYAYNQIKGSSGFAQADLARLFADYIDSEASDTIPSFSFNKNIVIDHTEVVSDLQDFPVLVDIWDQDLHLNAQPDGDDIAFLYNGQVIPYDLDLFDKQGDGTYAHLVCWVKAPHLSSVEDTTIVMVYGDENLGSQENPDAVWDSGYSAVWHMSDNPSQPQWDSSQADYLPHQPQIVDSTSHNLDGTTYGTMASTDRVSGYIGNAIELDGVNDYIDYGDPADLQMSGAFTVEAWFKADFIDNDYLVVKSGEANYRGWDISFDYDPSISPAGWVMFRYSPDGINTYLVGYERVDTSQWYHVVGVFNPSVDARFYLNGELVEEVTTGIPASVYDPARPVRIGRRSDNPGGTSYLDAIVDEVRISNIARSDAWIKTQYNNEKNPELFLTVGEQGINFQYKKDITIDHNKVAADLTGFPVLIDIYDSDLHTKVQPDGDDIMFTSNGRSLPHEIELFDQQYNSTHAHLVAWVRADISSVSNTVISMYYANSAMGSKESPEEVWRNQYQGVWHLGESPSVGKPAPQIMDSTYNNNDGTTYGTMLEEDKVPGLIGNAIDFDGSNDYIDCGDTASLAVGYNDFVMSLWFATSDLDAPFANKGAIGTDAYRYMLSVTSSGTIKAEIDDNSASPGKISMYSASALNDGLWHYAVMVRDGNLLHFYIDGFEVPTSPVDITGYGSINSVEPFLIAACDNYDNAGSPNLFVSAKIDEVHVLSSATTSAWILTEFNNQNDPSGFYLMGSEQEVTVPKEVPLEFIYKKDIIIDHTKVDSDLYGFPVLLDIYDTDFRFDVQADGDDIVFVKDGWILPYEVELFEQSYNSTHGHLIAWVRTDLSASSDTVLTMYYGNPSSKSYENPHGVWDTFFAGVWHLSEDPTGTVYDSTSNGNNGIGLPVGTEPTLQSGKIDGCSEFYGETTNERIESPHSSSLVLQSNMMVEAWIRTSNSDSTSDVIVAKWGDVGHRNYWLGKLDSSTLAFYVDNTQSVTASFSLVNDGYWHHVVGVANAVSGNLFIYVDGVERSSAPYSSTSQTGTSVLQIGNNPGSTGFIQEWDGRIDEVRVSSSYRSSSWITTEFNNQNDPISFYTVTERTATVEAFDFIRQVTITTGIEPVQAGYSTSVTINHAALVASGKSQADGDDLRIMYWNGQSLVELDRVLDSDSSWDTATTKLWFMIQSDIPASTSDDNYYLFYGNPSASSPPKNHANVFQFYDGFESGDLSAWDGSYTDTGDTLSVTMEHANTGTYSAKGEVDDQAAAQAMAWKDFSDETSLFARVHFYLPATFSTTDHVTIMQFVDTSTGWVNQLSLTIRDDMTLYLWNAIAGEAYGYGTTSVVSKGSWHMLEMQAKFSATTGEARLWVDGNLEVEETGKNLGTEGVDRFCTVFYWETPQTEPNIVYADDAFLRLYVNPEPTTSFGAEFQQGAEFNYRKDITIDHAKVGADLNDFPMLIDIYDSDLKTKVQSNGDDIIFKSNGIQLPHEIELFDQNYNSTHAHLVAWVRTDLSSAVDTIVTMYYGNPLMQNEEDPANVWSNGYMGVWHLSEASGNAQDSTLYETDGTPSGLITQGVAGRIGDAYYFDRDGVGTVNMGDPADGHLDFGNTEDFTIEFWVNLDYFYYYEPFLVSKRGGLASSSPGYSALVSDDNNGFAGYSVSSDGPQFGVDATTPLLDTGWRHVVYVFDQDSDAISTIYVDGGDDKSSTWGTIGNVGTLSNNQNFRLNGESSPSTDRMFDGMLDEVRISRVARSANWILTEFNNQYAPTSFFTIGSEVRCAPLDLAYEKDITIDHTKVNADLNDFPLLIDIYDSDLKTKVQSDGDDIIFKSNGLRLPHEIETFEQSYNGTHAHLIAWVKTDLSSSVDTVITMYYGNPDVGNQENAAGVWDTNYKGVWHLSENPTGMVYDSTSNSNDGTGYNLQSDDQVGGQVDGSIDFDDTQDYISCGNDTSLNVGSNDFSLSLWFKYDGVSTGTLAGKGAVLMAKRYRLSIESGPGMLMANIDDDNIVKSISSTLTYGDNLWHLVSMVRDGNYLRLYIDGAEDPNSPIDITGYGSLDEVESFYINAFRSEIGGTLGYYSTANIDEVRVAKMALSPEWIAAEHSSQYDPSSFYSIGPEKTSQAEYQPNVNAAEFEYRKNLIVDHTMVAEDLTDFPMLIDIFDTDLRTDVQANGNDIMFKTGYYWCPYEIVFFDQTYNETHAHLIAWVRVDLSSSIDTTITMYYGNPDLTSQQNPNAVWNDYVGVWHLDESPTGTVVDSSQYNNYGTTLGSMTGSDLVPGQVGSGFELDGIDDMINVSESSSLDSMNYAGTLSLWINWVDSSNDLGIQRILSTSNRFIVNPSPPPTYLQVDGFEWGAQLDGDCFFYPWGGDGTDYNLVTNPFSNNYWHFVVLTLDYSTKSVKMFLDGNLLTFQTENVPSHWTQLANLGDWLWGGNNVVSNYQVQGKFDEIRASSTVRSSGWILTEYNNQHGPNSFYTIGSEEKVNANGYIFTTSSESSITIGTKLSLGVQTSILSYADDLTQGTSFSIVNGSLPIWTANVMVSPPPELEAVSFEISYPEGEWWPFSVASPSGVEKTFATDWTCFNGQLIVSSTAIDEYGMWKIKFLDRNHVLDTQIGPSGGPYSTTGQFAVGQDIQFHVWSSGTIGSTISLDLTDPSGATWYTGSTTFQGTRFSLPYHHRKYLTIGHDNVAEDLADFPVLVDICDTDLRTDVRPDGRDIAFAIGERTLSHEIELFDQTYNTTHAHLVAWVNVPVLSGSTDTVVSMYYGNPLAPIVYDSGPVWDPGYLGVWHLSESGTGALGEYQDSSQYKNDGQGGDGDSLFVPTQTAGKIGAGQEFNNLDGYYDFIDCGDSPLWDIDGYQITLEAWIQHDITPNNHVYGIMNHKGWYDGYALYINYGGGATIKPTFSLPGDTHQLVGANDVTGGSWHQIVATYDGSLMRIYVDGVQDPNVLAKTNAIEPSSFEKDFWIGQGDQPQNKTWSAEWDGQIDEVRVSDVTRSAGWIQTQFNNQYNPSGFYSIGMEENMGYSESASINLDTSAPAGVWHATTRYSDSNSDVILRTGIFDRTFIVKRGTSLSLTAPGDAILDGISTKLIGEQLYVEFDLQDTLTSTMVSGATVSMNWSISGTPTDVQLNDYGDGRYGKTLNTSDLGGYGRWRLDVQASHSFYSDATDFLYLDLSHRTFMTYEPPNDTPYGDNFEIRLTLKDKFDNTPLTGATLSCNATILGIPTDYGNGTYLVTVDSTGFSSGEHTFRFTATPSTTYLLSSSIDVQFNYRSIATETTPSSPDAVEAPWGQQVNTSIYWFDIDHAGIGVDSGTISISPIVPILVDESSIGNYLITIDMSSYMPGTYYFDLTCSKQNYQSSTTTISILILPHRTTPSVNYNSTIPVGTNVYFDVLWMDLDLDSIPVGTGNLTQVSLDWGTGSDSHSVLGFWMDTSGWAAGSYSFNVTIIATASPRFYMDSYIVVHLEIRKLGVYVSWEPLEAFPNGNDFVMFVHVNVSEPGNPIDGIAIAGLDQTYFSARNETGGLYIFESFLNLGDGRYQITIDNTRFLEGQYEIIVFVDFLPTENYTDSSTTQVSFTYRPILTYLSSPNYPSVTTSFDTNVTITLSYVDIDHIQNITTGIMTSEGALIEWQHIGSGTYEVLIIVQGWNLGAHEVNITADASGYQAKTLTFQILVQIAYAYARSSVSIIDLPLGDTAVFYADYWDITHDEAIIGATLNHNWTYPLSISWTGDQYRIELPSIDTDSLGTYLVVLNFSKGPNYQFGYINISIILRTHLTEFRLASAIEPTSYNAMVNISVYCGDLDNTLGIIDAPVNLSVYGESGWISSTFKNDTTLGNGYYIISFAATNLGTSGIYDITVYFNWTGPVPKFYDNSVVSSVRIVGEASDLELIVSAEPTPYLENLSYTYFYSELYSGNGISNVSAPAGNVFIYVEFASQSFSPSLFSIKEDSGNPGHYTIEFNSTIFAEPGVYTMVVHVNWTKTQEPFYGNWTDTVSVRLIPRSTLINLDPPESTPYGVNATFSFSFDDVAGSVTYSIANSSQMRVTIGLPDYSLTYNISARQFHVSFNTSILGAPLGTRQFTIGVSWIGAPFYANLTGRNVLISVRYRETEFDYSTISPTAYGDNVTLHMAFIDTTPGQPQTIDDGFITLYNGSVEIPVTEYSFTPLGNGEYEVELRTTYFTKPGTYTIKVMMSTSHFYYGIVTASRTLSLRYRLTVLLIEPVEETPYNNSLQVVFHYSDVLTLSEIGNSSTPTTVQILNGSSWFFVSVWRGASEDYLLTIETYNQNLEINREYVLWIQVSYPDSSPFYLTAEAFVSFTLQERATILEITESPEPTQYLDSIDFAVLYQDSLSSAGIAGAMINLTVGGMNLVEGIDYLLFSPYDGSYYISLNTTTLGPAGSSVNLELGASWTDNEPYYSTSTLSLTLTVTERNSITEIVSSTTQVKFLENVTFTIRYSDETSGKLIQFSNDQLLIYNEGILLSSNDFAIVYLGSGYEISINSSVLAAGLINNQNITFYIDWQNTVAPYYADGRASSWVTVTNRIGIVIRGVTPTVPIHDNMTLNFTYVDDTNGAGINDAIVVFDCLSPSGLIEGTDFWVYRNSGDYSIIVDTTSLGSTGTFTFSLRLLWNPTVAPYYRNTATIFLQGSVRLIQLQLTNEEPVPSTVPINDNVSVILNLQDLDHLVPISGAESLFSVEYKTNASGPYIWSITPILPGIYNLTVDCYDAGTTGTNALIITLALPDYQIVQVQVPFQIRLRQGELNELVSQKPYYSETTFVIVELVDTDANNTPISDATLSITWPDIGYTPYYSNLGNGQYNITLTTSSLDAGLYTLVVGALRSDYFISDISVPVQIQSIPTELILPQSIPDVYWGDAVSFWAVFNDTRDGTIISGAILTYQFGALGGSLTEIVSDQGNYTATVDTGNLVLASTYVISITAIFNNYVIKTSQVLVNVLKLPTTVSIISGAQQEVFKGTPVNMTVYVNSTYRNIPLLGSTVTARWVLQGPQSISLSPVPGKDGYYTCFIDTNDFFVGQYSITIEAGGTNYLRSVAPASIKVKQIATVLQLDALTSSYSDQSFNWSDTIRIGVYVLVPSLNESHPFSTGLSNCTVQWSLSGTTFTGEFLNGTSVGGPGYFYFDFETWDYDASTYTLRITAYPNIGMFAYSSNLTTLIIEPIETSVESTYLSPKIWGWTGWVDITYWDLLFDRGIAGATVQVEWDGGESTFTYVANGTYQVFINASLVSPGIYPVSVRFTMDNYKSGTGVFTLNVKEVPTDIAAFAPPINQIDHDVLNLQVPYGDTISLTFFYNDTWYNQGITGATEMTCVILGTSIPDGDHLLIEEITNGNYSLLIDTTRWTVSSDPYRLILNFHLTNWSRATLDVHLTIIDVPTALYIDPSSVTMNYGQVFSIWVLYYDTWEGHMNASIVGASINATSLDTRFVDVSLNQSDPSRPGWYEIRVRSYRAEGTALVSIILSKDNYVSISALVTVSVEPSEFDLLVERAIFFGVPIGAILLLGAVLWTRLFSVPKQLRAIRRMVRTIAKGKIPKPPDGVLSRQEIVADLFNDIAEPIGITKLASSMPSEPITSDVPEIEELLIQLSILSKLSPEELDDFKLDVSKMKLSEQVSFVKEVINQEAIKQARLERKPMEVILEETAAKARAVLAGEEIEVVVEPKPLEERIIPPEVEEPEEAIPEPVEFEEVESAEMLDEDELKQIRKKLESAGIKGSELETIMDQARELPRALAEELLRSILGKGGEEE